MERMFKKKSGLLDRTTCTTHDHVINIPSKKSNASNSSKDSNASTGKDKYITFALAYTVFTSGFEFSVFVSIADIISMLFFTKQHPNEFITANYWSLLKIVSLVGASYCIRIFGAIFIGFLYNITRVRKGILRMDAKNIVCLASLIYCLSSVSMCFLKTGSPTCLIIIRLLIGIADGIDLIGSYLFVYDRNNKSVDDKRIDQWNGDGTLKDMASFEKSWNISQRQVQKDEEFHDLHNHFNTYGFIGNTVGVFLATGLRLLMSSDHLNEYGWRLPFYISAILSGVALLLRLMLLPRTDTSYTEDDHETTHYTFKDYIHGLSIYCKCQWRELLLIASIFIFWGAGNYSVIVFIMYLFQSMLILLNTTNTDPSNIISFFLWFHLNSSKKLTSPDENIKEEFGGQEKRFTEWRYNILDVITKHHKLIESQQKVIEFLLKQTKKKSGLDKKKSGLGLKKAKKVNEASDKDRENPKSSVASLSPNNDSSNVDKVEIDWDNGDRQSKFISNPWFFPIQLLTTNIFRATSYNDALELMYSIDSPKTHSPKE